MLVFSLMVFYILRYTAAWNASKPAEQLNSLNELLSGKRASHEGVFCKTNWPHAHLTWPLTRISRLTWRNDQKTLSHNFVTPFWAFSSWWPILHFRATWWPPVRFTPFYSASASPTVSSLRPAPHLHLKPLRLLRSLRALPKAERYCSATSLSSPSQSHHMFGGMARQPHKPLLCLNLLP